MLYEVRFLLLFLGVDTFLDIVRVPLVKNVKSSCVLLLSLLPRKAFGFRSG